jgi:uncharacterized protein YdhG (YjbR/CyaY superfamily)
MILQEIIGQLALKTKNVNMNEIGGSKSVEEYFDSQTEETKKSLLELRKCILKVAPNATELLNYDIPAYALVENGKREQQIMIAGYKKHVGLYPHPTTMEKFEPELKEYKRGKGSVQFPLHKPLPTELIQRMIKYRMELLTK